MKALLVVLLTLAPPVYAEVFKCKVSDFKVVYQAVPCVGAIEGQKIEIRQRSAEEEAAAVSRLKEWETGYAAEQAAKKDALKAKQEEMRRQAEIEATQKNAEAAQKYVESQREREQEEEVQRQLVRELERSTIIIKPEMTPER